MYMTGGIKHAWLISTDYSASHISPKQLFQVQEYLCIIDLIVSKLWLIMTSEKSASPFPPFGK